MELDLEEASFIALVENLQRNDLDFLEESRGIAQLIRLFGLSQEECARRLGKSQSAVANKLRLLRLPEDVLNAMRNAGLTERHGRALLRLEDEDSQRRALDFMIEQRLTVAAAEEYIESLVRAAGEDATGTSDADERCPPDTDAGTLPAAPAAAASHFIVFSICPLLSRVGKNSILLQEKARLSRLYRRRKGFSPFRLCARGDPRDARAKKPCAKRQNAV